MDGDAVAVAEFCGVTGGTPEQARFYMDASGGQFERAVSMFYEQEAQRDAAGFAAASSPRAAPVARQGRQGAAGRGWRQHGTLLGALFSLPRAVVQAGVGVVGGTLRLTAAVLGLLASRTLPAPLLRSLQGRVRALTQGREADPAAAAAALAGELARRHPGREQPDWVAASWGEAAREAHRRFKFLFVYLHAPGHQDTEAFYSGTLRNAEVVSFLGQHFLCWAGDVTQPDAFQLAQGLRVAAYPCVALLAFSGARTRLLTAAQGAFAPAQLLPVLRGALEAHGGHLLEEQVEHGERASARALRQEQDDAYQRSLAADREREQQRAAERQAAADAQRRQQEAAAAEQAAEEAEAKRLQDRRAAVAARRQRKQAALAPETPAGAPDSVQVRVRLPDGSNHQRRFPASDPLQRAYDFVDSLEGLQALAYSLASSYPRRVFSGDAAQQSFQQLGLAPQAMLLVQSEDD